MPATNRQPRKVVPSAHGRAALILEINGVPYRVCPLRPTDPAVRRAYRLKKADGTAYDVAETDHGPSCDCPDFTFRRDGIDPGGCKHLKALAAWGLIGPVVAVAAEPAECPAWADPGTWSAAYSADAEEAERQARFRAATR